MIEDGMKGKEDTFSSEEEVQVVKEAARPSKVCSEQPYI